MDYVRPHYFKLFFIISLISLFVPRVTIFAWPTERRATEKFVQVYKIELSDGTGQQGSALERSKVRCGNWHLGLMIMSLSAPRADRFIEVIVRQGRSRYGNLVALSIISRATRGWEKEKSGSLLQTGQPLRGSLSHRQHTQNKGNNTIFYSLYCFSQTWLNSFDFTNKINLSIKK